MPLDPVEQLRLAVDAVFRSWSGERAVKYRAIRKISGLLGTAVNVQAMVFGNYNTKSGSGVVFTRSPVTGEPALYGEYLIDAQVATTVALLDGEVVTPDNEFTCGRREKTWWRVSERRTPSALCARRCPTRTRSCWPTALGWSTRTAI
jgi:phosphoenolpyruvate synthase/pyruvate phosphate dikinase